MKTGAERVSVCAKRNASLGLGLSTSADFEKSRRDVSRAAVYSLRAALEKAGVQFIEKDGGGPGVRSLS